MNQIYREIIEDSPMGYMYIKVINDNKGRYTGVAVRDFNKSYEKFFGNHDENTINKYILNCMPRQEKLEWEKIFIEANESEKYTKKVYVDVNDKFLEFFNKTYDEVIGKTDYDIMPKNFAKEFTIQDNDIIKNNKLNTYEDFISSNFNKIGYFQTIKWPFTEYYNDTILGTIGISIEITNKVKLFKNIEKMRKYF